MAPSPPLVGTLARLFARLQQGALFNYQLRCKQYAFKPRTGREVYALASNEPAIDPAVDQRLGDLNAVGLDLSVGPDRQSLPRGQPLAAQGAIDADVVFDIESTVEYGPGANQRLPVAILAGVPFAHISLLHIHKV